MTDRLSIYVSSPDSYADVFEVFLKGFRKYWSNCPYEFILTTNTCSYEGLTCLCNHTPGDTWVQRTLAALPHIKSKYILLMCDDLIINRKVDNQAIEDILDYMDAENIRFCRLNPLPKKHIIAGIPFLSKVNRQSPYAVNLQIGIFRLDFFTALLGDGQLSAWDIENNLIAEASCATNEFFTDVVAVNRFVIPFVHGVIKGLWFRKALSDIQKEFPDYVVKRGVVPWTMQMKLSLISVLQRILSPGCRKRLKRIGRSLGISFVTDN